MFTINAFAQEEAPIDTTIDNTELYIVYQQNAKFNGGAHNDFVKWVHKQIVYPQESIKNKEEGIVYIEFIVSNQGNLEQIKILQSSGFPLLDQEAIRIITSSPKWTPAKLPNGTKVSQPAGIPIRFELPE